MARVQLEIPDSQCDEWEAFVDGSGAFRSGADVIRTAVARYIATDGDSETDRLNDDVTQIPEQVTGYSRRGWSMAHFPPERWPVVPRVAYSA